MDPASAILLGSLLRDGSRPSDNRGIPEAQVERLHQLCDRYSQPNPFHAGDLVTPRRDGSVSGAGDPHIVLETIEPAMPSFRSDACCREKRFDTRVTWVTLSGKVGTIWVEAFDLEPWSPGATRAAAAETPAEAPAAA